MHVCLPACLSFKCLPHCQAIYLCIYLPVPLSIIQTLHISTCISAYMTMTIYLSIGLFMWYVCFYACRYVSLSIYWYVCLSLSLSLKLDIYWNINLEGLLATWYPISSTTLANNQPKNCGWSWIHSKTCYGLCWIDQRDRGWAHMETGWNVGRNDFSKIDLVTTWRTFLVI